MPIKASTAQALTFANIALAKYWGKADTELNLPAVPSVSIALDALTTNTTVRFDSELRDDELWLNGKKQQGRALRRVVELLDQVRVQSNLEMRCRVWSENNFPTAAGLASSASAFAALSLAAREAAGLPADTQQASILARRASASAARSVFGGFVKLPAGTPGDDSLSAESIAPAEHWDLRVIIAVISQQPKKISSTDGMLHTQRTSPFFDSWVSMSSSLAADMERAILDKDFTKLGELSEHSAFAMHACAMAARPAVTYLNGNSLQVIEQIKQLRHDGIAAYVTMDAGPQIKVLTLPEHEEGVLELLKNTPEVLKIIPSKLADGAVVMNLGTES